MSQLNSYLESLLPEPITILGFTLQPFSLGHLNILQRMGYASFINGFQATAESIAKYTVDYFVTVLVCAMTYEEAKDAFEKDIITIRHTHKKADNTFSETYSKACFSEYVQQWSKEIECACNSGIVNMLQDMSAVQKYIKKAFAGPDAYPIEDDSVQVIKSGAPWEQGLRDFLLTKYSESEAMNLPLSLAFWEWAKEAEKNRQLCIKSENDVRAIELLKEMSK